MCWQVEEVCNCNPVSSKNIGLSQADPSDHPRVRFVTVWTAGVVFGHLIHPAALEMEGLSKDSDLLIVRLSANVGKLF